MNQLVLISSPALPSWSPPPASAGMRFLEFFAANIRNPQTRQAYYRAAQEFLAWCASVGLSSIATVEPVHVAAWIERGISAAWVSSGFPEFCTADRLGAAGKSLLTAHFLIDM